MHTGTECDIGRLSNSLLFVKLCKDSIGRLVITAWMDSDMGTHVKNPPKVCRIW